MPSRRSASSNPGAISVRDATEHDLPAVLSIYNDAILRTTAVWGDEPVDLASRVRWLQERRSSGYPVLVADAAGDVCGFASFGDFRPWAGYRHTVEHSVYVAAGRRRQGIGRRLMMALIEAARADGKHVLIGAIEAANAASVAMHADLGFREAGRLTQVGAKFGRWLDLVFMEIRLDERPTP